MTELVYGANVPYGSPDYTYGGEGFSYTPDPLSPLFSSPAPEVLLEGWPLELIDLGLTLDSTPARSDDSSGSVGEVSFTGTMPFNPDHPLNEYGVKWSRRKSYEGVIGRYRFQGEVSDFSLSEDRSNVFFQATLRTVDLNTFNARMGPFQGDLGNYAKQFETDRLLITVDPDIANQQILAPGWEGETWYWFKMFCAAYGLDAILDGNTLHLSPFRSDAVWADGFHDTGVTYQSQSGNDAQAVEVYSYNGSWVSHRLVYPTGGWNEDVDVLTVNAGEVEEYDLEVDGSLESIETPIMTTFVSRSDNSISQYTVVADDGFPVQPAMWADRGGNVEVSLNEDSKSIKVRFTGAHNIPRSDGTYSETFAIALASDTSGHQYSTLRIRGTGIIYDKTKLRIATGVPEEQTGTEVGVTIDNPFLIKPNMAYEAAVATSAAYQGYALSGTSEAANPDGFRPGDIKRYFEEEGLVFRTRSVQVTPFGETFTVELDTRIKDIPAPSGVTVGDFDAHNSGLTVMDTMLRGKGMMPNGN